jgi:hypothetical protein
MQFGPINFAPFMMGMSAIWRWGRRVGVIRLRRNFADPSRSKQCAMVLRTPGAQVGEKGSKTVMVVRMKWLCPKTLSQAIKFRAGDWRNIGLFLGGDVLWVLLLKAPFSPRKQISIATMANSGQWHETHLNSNLNLAVAEAGCWWLNHCHFLTTKDFVISALCEDEVSILHFNVLRRILNVEDTCTHLSRNYSMLPIA